MVISCRICYRIVPHVDSQNLCDQCGGYDKSSVLPNYYCLWEVDEACKKCTYPLHVGHGQEHRFCPNCTTDAVHAKRGRELLEKLKAKLAARDGEKQAREEFEKESPKGYWPAGLPL